MTMSRSLRTACLVLAAVTALAVGCKGPATATPAATMIPTASLPVDTLVPTSPSDLAPSAPTSSATAGSLGTTGRIQDDSQGFAITLPDGWNRLNVSGSDVDQMLAAGSVNMTPAAAAALKQQLAALSTNGVTFVAIGPSTPTFTNNVNIIVSPNDGSATTKAAMDEVKSQASSMAHLRGAPDVTLMTYPAGDAVHAVYSVSTKLADGSAISPTIDQHIFIGPSRIYTVTVTGLEAGQTTAAAEAMAQAFEILP